ncbi:bacteriohopanetetrol glucosamine biosynthesis glycosyltransferase HpnI [Edaphosphingomonas haloaromaticamans]|uniref:Glycosyl transferase family 2 n=1 Tax=Edaphosphingomonas haloaromaticamans TaxID=653954 RepID=A0A1S1HJD0_9SPHN|nr:bacteriohopanetetrol glucosamine biosynthesis glycosyltransferase HpnI [Sphingomonas haloaromaticamans]OHT22158.1 Glycosyl transferase family 2 [Sphingomonas haloaromaticamans]
MAARSTVDRVTMTALLLPQCLAVAGILYTLAATILAGRWKSGPIPPENGPPVTILKPLHGAEPLLAENLRSFVEQDYRGAVEIVCGVHDPADPAAAVARAIDGPVRVRADRARHGSNGKISNLINMMSDASGDIIILSDSDIAVPPDYISRIVATIAPAGTIATCLYAGRGDAGAWSRIAAAGISWQFLPSVIVGLATGRARPCMGSTIAMRRETLDRIGGFAPFADVLADDHAIGAAAHAAGCEVAIPRLIVTHGCAETSLAALARHELRWNATIRGLDPWGYAGSIVTHPLPLALLGLNLWLVAAALAARLALALRIDRLAGRRTAPIALLPLRDILSFILFLGAFAVRSIDWRGGRFRLGKDGRMSADTEYLT